MLTFGNVSNASIRVIPNGLDCCDVEFESVESRRRAIASGQFSVKNFYLSISRLHVLHTVTIRIKNICSVTPDSAIHSMCMSCGPLEGFSRTKDDIVDALFRVKDNSDEQCILKMLNNTTMDDCKWSAILELKESTPVVVTDSNRNDSRCQLGYQIGSQIDDLKRQLNVKRVQLQDLEYLHHALVHLQLQPDLQ
ncbi:hypothetical protein CFOL_v3_36005 [Cephalotus follicularis]|uniref:Uncharacterized protein n=1 Tax=Cephalotus follicularis TaxID=3775 RepID=A0A1Q3DJE5_CEPFO|nr:hypothetical protein CFOL_v3_30219 [Cephalotus follicularis]GAV92627.1 hypothetical protein CFOL_v3_36005 [Cephalotus follicularis]